MHILAYLGLIITCLLRLCGNSMVLDFLEVCVLVFVFVLAATWLCSVHRALTEVELEIVGDRIIIKNIRKTYFRDCTRLCCIPLTINQVKFVGLKVLNQTVF